jgi:hypothetical protein
LQGVFYHFKTLIELDAETELTEIAFWKLSKEEQASAKVGRTLTPMYTIHLSMLINCVAERHVVAIRVFLQHQEQEELERSPRACRKERTRSQEVDARNSTEY